MSRVCAGAVSLAMVNACMGQSPALGGPMQHVMVSYDGQTLHAMVDESVPVPVLREYGATYAGAAAVLNGTMFNAQYGWMVDGFWTLPAGASLRIEQMDVSPGMRTYLGRVMGNPATYSPIFGTDGSAASITWNGAMLHNWYAVTERGAYEATYSVYVADAAGAKLSAFGEASVTLTWTTPACDGIDFNNNGVFPEDQDVLDFLSVLAGADCPQCNDIDFNNNAVFPEDQDVVDFFTVLAGGTCN